MYKKISKQDIIIILLVAALAVISTLTILNNLT